MSRSACRNATAPGDAGRCRAAPHLDRLRRVHRRADRSTGCSAGSRTTASSSTNPFGLPDPWVRSNYTDILDLGVVLAAAVEQPVHRGRHDASLVVGVSAMAAFVFARFAFRGRELLFTLFAIGLMFPFAVAILPLFILLRALACWTTRSA